MMTRLTLCLLTLACLLHLSGCNTVEGVGQDLQGLGEAIEDTAN